MPEPEEYPQPDGSVIRVTTSRDFVASKRVQPEHTCTEEGCRSRGVISLAYDRGDGSQQRPWGVFCKRHAKARLGIPPSAALDL